MITESFSVSDYKCAVNEVLLFDTCYNTQIRFEMAVSFLF